MTQSPNISWKISNDTNGRRNFASFVTPNEKYLIYFSNIEEYGMMKFCSLVQIWTDKENPKLIYRPRNIEFEYQFDESCYYLEKSDLIILLTPCIKTKYFDLPYILLDFKTEKFTPINAPNFHITEIDEDSIRLEKKFRYIYDEETTQQILLDDNKVIILSQLKWHDLTNIDIACSLISENNR